MSYSDSCFGKSKPEDGDRFYPQNIVNYISIHTMKEVYEVSEK